MIKLYLVLLFLSNLFGFVGFNKETGLDKEIDYRRRIFDEHYATLKHTQLNTRPFFVCFSATPGMGKSYIAKILEENTKLYV